MTVEQFQRARIKALEKTLQKVESINMELSELTLELAKGLEFENPEYYEKIKDLCLMNYRLENFALDA